MCLADGAILVNFKNLVEILRCNVDYKEVHRHLNFHSTCEFMGASGVDIITVHELLVIERIRDTSVIKELISI